jgi:flagellar hook protein FlgE
MQRLCLARNFETELFANSDSHTQMNKLSHVRIDDDGNIIAVFSDNSELDVTALFSAAMVEDYREHAILVRC